jgi:hypothetical protein
MGAELAGEVGAKGMELVVSVINGTFVDAAAPEVLVTAAKQPIACACLGVYVCFWGGDGANRTRVAPHVTPSNNVHALHLVSFAERAKGGQLGQLYATLPFGASRKQKNPYHRPSLGATGLTPRIDAA